MKSMFLSDVVVGAPFGNMTLGEIGLVGGPSPIRAAEKKEPEAKYPDEKFPDWIKKLIKETWPKAKDAELKGDADGAAVVAHDDDVDDPFYDNKKKKGERLDRRFCGGDVTYVIPVKEVVADPIDPNQRRRLLDWAYALKRAEASRKLNGCESDACDENEVLVDCIMHKSGQGGNFVQKNSAGNVVNSVGYVSVRFVCKCAEPEEPEQGPITGPGK